MNKERLYDLTSGPTFEEHRLYIMFIINKSVFLRDEARTKYLKNCIQSFYLDIFPNYVNNVECQW